VTLDCSQGLGFPHSLVITPASYGLRSGQQFITTGTASSLATKVWPITAVAGVARIR